MRGTPIGKRLQVNIGVVVEAAVVDVNTGAIAEVGIGPENRVRDAPIG